MPNIICASYFDPLGHPLFADKIASNLSSSYKGVPNVSVYGVDIKARKDIYEKKFIVIPINVPLFGRFYKLTTRNFLQDKFGILGRFGFFCIRFWVCSVFYFKVYRLVSAEERLIDLEYEPIQSFFAAAFSRIPHHHVMVLHSFPKKYGKNLKSLYKLISRALVKFQLKKSKNSYLALMHERAIAHAKSQGFKDEDLLLAGWGFDLKPAKLISKRDAVTNPGLIKVLSFGVLRHDKRIEKLVRLFLSLDDKRIELNVVGKSFNVDVVSLNKEIQNFGSKTRVTIEDKYIDEDEVAGVFNDCDVTVISHDSSFDSASGPLALAFEFEKPVLCFSSNFVAELVYKSNFGVVADMESITNKDLIEQIIQLPTIQHDLSKIKHYEWHAIAKRLISNPSKI